MRAGQRASALRVLVELGSGDTKIGAVNDALDLVELIPRERAQFVLTGPFGCDLREEAARRGAETLSVSSRAFSRRGLIPYGVDVLRWMQRLAVLRADVVHLNYAGYGPSLACAAHLCGVPVVGRAGPYVPSNPSNQWIDAYVGNCRPHAAELLESPLAGRVTIAGDLFRPGRLGEATSGSRPIPPRRHGAIRILFLGQLVERKGLSVLIDALSRVRADVEVLLVGGDWSAPGYPQELRAQAARLGVESRVVFENHRPDVGALLRTSDVFVLPSLSEARPRSIIEAMWLGLPVIATRVGGIPSLVEDGHTGMLVDPGDAASLAAAITTLAESAECRARMGAAGRERAERECRPQQTAAAYLDLYERLTARRAPSHDAAPIPGAV